MNSLAHSKLALLQELIVVRQPSPGSCRSKMRSQRYQDELYRERSV